MAARSHGEAEEPGALIDEVTRNAVLMSSPGQVGKVEPFRQLAQAALRANRGRAYQIRKEHDDQRAGCASVQAQASA